MGKTIKSVSAKPDDPMFTGVTFISAIMRPELPSEVKPKKTTKSKRKEKNNGKNNRNSKYGGIVNILDFPEDWDED